MGALADEISHIAHGANPFGWVPGAEVLAIVKGRAAYRDQLTLSEDRGVFVMRYFFDRDHGPMFIMTLGRIDDPASAITNIRPELATLCGEELAAGRRDSAARITQLISYLTEALNYRTNARHTDPVVPATTAPERARRRT